ncbi:MAG: hypothetical protein K2X82_18260 [Gemmataceae bacterium]|nr:hypothetical protein [Gemmataceae bacterium]
MLLRRAFAGVVVLFGLSVWSWARGDAAGDPREAEPVRTAVAAGEYAGGNRDDAAYRFRTNQARHWRHVMIGGR